MGQPRLLDLFCKAGGAARGYQLAGFHVTGVDIEPQSHYCGDAFIQADALSFLSWLIASGAIRQFQAIHASPPCQHDSWSARRWRNAGRQYPDLIAPTLALLEASGLPFICENVVGAPLLNAVTLCGSMFGLRVLRHRLFVANALLFSAGTCQHKGSVRGGEYVTVAGHGGDGCARYDVWCEAMGIDWMDKQELTQAIPPAYTLWLGRQLRAVIASSESEMRDETMNTNEIKQRLDDACDMLARGNDNYERGNDSMGYVFGILAELLEVVKAQQAEIERLTDESNNHRH